MTMLARRCRTSKCEQKDKDGNCLIPGSDGLAVQCVGPWVEDKYNFLESYLNASRKARGKFSVKGTKTALNLPWNKWPIRPCLRLIQRVKRKEKFCTILERGTSATWTTK
jgi:hypothetical protein